MFSQNIFYYILGLATHTNETNNVKTSDLFYIIGYIFLIFVISMLVYALWKKDKK